MQQQVISQTFNVADNYNTNGIFYESVAISKSVIYTNGYGSEISSPLNPKLYISKFTKTGNFIYNKGYTEPGLALFSSPHGLIVKNDSVFNFGEVQGNGYFNRIFCLVTDTLGNKLFFKEYLDTTSENEVLYQSQILQNKKGFLLVGLVQKSSTLDVNAGVFLFNNKLEITAKYEFGNSNKREIAYSATQLPNGNLVIGAHRYDAQKVNGTRYQEQTWIFEIDTNGTMVREFLDPDTQTGPAKGITQTQDGGFVYCGNYQTDWNGIAGYSHKPSISKLNPNFNNKEWEVIYYDTVGGDQTFEKIIEFRDSYIAIGTMFTEYPNDWGLIWGGAVVKFDELGNVSWSKGITSSDSIENKNYHYFYDGILDEKGNIICAGQVEQDQGPNLGWVLKLDSNGCLTETNCGYPALNVVEIMKQEKDIIVYPNPFAEKLQIESENPIVEIQIFDVFGKLVFQKTKSTNQIELGFLPKGIYLLKLKAATGEWVTQKVVKY